MRRRVVRRHRRFRRLRTRGPALKQGRGPQDAARLERQLVGIADALQQLQRRMASVEAIAGRVGGPMIPRHLDKAARSVGDALYQLGFAENLAAEIAEAEPY